MGVVQHLQVGQCLVCFVDDLIFKIDSSVERCFESQQRIFLGLTQYAAFYTLEVKERQKKLNSFLEVINPYGKTRPAVLNRKNPSQKIVDLDFQGIYERVYPSKMMAKENTKQFPISKWVPNFPFGHTVDGSEIRLTS